LASWAGLNLARALKILHVVESRVLEPLDLVTLQPVTRPLGPTVSETPTLPCSLLSKALGG
jgi:hypothetical protein